MENKYIIYGAGNLGKIAYNFIKDFKFNICCVVDSDPPVYENDDFWKGVNIKKLDELTIEEKSTAIFLICISNYSFWSIKTNLKLNNCKNILSFFKLTNQVKSVDNYIPNGWELETTKSNKRKLEKVITLFKDEHSKLSYTQFCLWRYDQREVLTGLCPIDTTNRYFIPEVTSVLKEDEVFVDVGAYDGRVSFDFMEKVKHKYKAIYMFEPDPRLFQKIKGNVEKEYPFAWEKLFGCFFALGDKRRQVKFLERKDFLSKCSESGKQLKQMYPLDYFIIDPSIIKCHIEGGELNFIKGAKKTIKKYRPIIMITTYHTEDGFYKIPMLLKKYCKNYDFYWRNHNYMGQGSVMYAIPQERKN